MGAGTRLTSIGYAVGIKEAMRRGDGADGKVVAVIGDGAMTGGVAFEAVHQAGGLGTPMWSSSTTTGCRSRRTSARSRST
jgi:1-deoxy-D-xylulose-5-phosphate synthase